MPSSDIEQQTGYSPGEINRILVALLNSIWDGSSIGVSTSFSPVGAHSSGLAISSAQVLYAPSGANKIRIQALTQNVRYTLDNTTPTASLGFQLKAGDPPVVIPISGGGSIKVIQETTTASLQYQWGK